MSSLIQVFAKAPVPGTVKTRLGKSLGDAIALRLHQRLCDHVITTVQSSKANSVEIWTTDQQEAHSFFQTYGLPIHIQQGRELGTRMDFALRHGLSRSSKVVVVGADVYSLTTDYLNQALDKLDSTEVVVGPALDGGYVLIGASHSVPELFRDIPWGTADVFAITLERMLSLALSFDVLPDRWDIDTLEDLKRYAPDLLQELINDNESTLV